MRPFNYLGAWAAGTLHCTATLSIQSAPAMLGSLPKEIPKSATAEPPPQAGAQPAPCGGTAANEAQCAARAHFKFVGWQERGSAARSGARTSDHCNMVDNKISCLQLLQG
ncbi:hypothetical protein FB45DRAFT_877497 [Roridomyces roridus]|uniref:Uncharacterized protein n=1 Tax=Roridomyces roridus TaxID=1738132 RepID=A0AAD7B2H0_9AGAR|nr:hypothetical protein FB45DRAFT_877497 [Roridomyces roridus]